LFVDENMRVSGDLGFQVVKNRTGRVMSEVQFALVQPEYFKVGGEARSSYFDPSRMGEIGKQFNFEEVEQEINDSEIWE
jgi:hypothetical protein